mgnify:FL=1
MNLDKIIEKTNFYPKNILLLGAADGIGQAISKFLINSNANLKIYITSREKNNNTSRIKYYQLEATEESDWLKFIKILDKEKIKFDLIINTIGILHDEENKIIPEKSIKNFNANSFIQNVKVNTLVTALCIKYMTDYFSKNNKVILASLTARLGSISDNNIGGWISYRASKAAQHMIIKTASIEIKRTNNNMIIVGLHPGTVETKLSKPYLKSASKIFDTNESAEKLLEVIYNLSNTDTGNIYDYSGRIIPY